MKANVYSMRKRIALFLTCFLMAGLAMAQSTQVTGTVISVDDGEPIPGASVVLEGTKQGVVTDADGKFTLTVPADVTRLEVACAGMVKQLVRVKPVVFVELQTDSKALDEVMVVAYGTATRASFTGSAAVIDAKDIEGRLVSDVTNALSGSVAGVQTLKSNGQPGTGSTVRIRGIGSMAASNAPLYVVQIFLELFVCFEELVQNKTNGTSETFKMCTTVAGIDVVYKGAHVF